MRRDLADTTAEADRGTRAASARIDGVVIGLLTGFDGAGRPLVVFAANRQPEALAARSTVALGADDIGGEIALLFESGDPRQPVVIGRIQRPEAELVVPADASRTVVVDGSRLVLSADQEIVLKCGKASITLTRAGKVILRGAYVSSRSSGVNRIKGGSVQIN